MKKLFSTLLLAAAIPFTMTANPALGTSKHTEAKKMDAPAKFVSAQDMKLNPILTTNSKGESLQNGSNKYENVRFFNVQGESNYYYVGFQTTLFETNPVFFEPTSGKLLVALPKPGDNLYKVVAHVSDDFGLTFPTANDIELASSTTTRYAFPSIYAINKDVTNKDAKKLNIFTATTYNANFAIDPPAWKDGADFLFYNQGVKSVQSESGPSSSYKWLFLQPVGVDAGQDGIFYYAAAQPSNVNSSQYGAYAFLAAEAETEMMVYDQTMPNAWGLSKFKPSTGAESTYNNHPYLGADQNGTLYMGVLNNFASDLNNRLLGISTSNDNGSSWSDFDIMPLNMLILYIESELNIDYYETTTYFPGFQQNDMIVFPNGDISYMTKLIATKDNQVILADYVEIKRVGGAWSMVKLAESSDATILTLEVNEINAVDAIEVKTNYRDNEIQMALTADGEYIVAKWIDGVVENDTIRTCGGAAPTFKFKNTDGNYVDMNLTNIETTDIFVAYRKVTESTWSEPINLTNDLRYNHLSHMPRYIPNLSNIPILTCVTPEPFNTQWEPLYNNLNEHWRGLINDVALETVMFVGNAINPPSFSTGFPETQSVSDPAKASNFSVYPNPSSDMTYVNIDAEKGSEVSVEVYNMLGEKVSNAFSGIFNGNAIAINSSELVNGTYLCKVTVDGNTTTAVFNVGR